ncbi:2-dehydro-3-deoxygalactonokinase [Pareuzebyella sediminis]|uniref:2-dehydro-3-deoxygalactonokinase n=1 Tax=Pareuzebyella sediminis TaxID=2607998 RepID=UPI0011ECC8DD|nr:2-dehydro-3-deoxygalactonokinase [Pareuzebyella sediminis]
MTLPSYFISCDWGTTNFRLRVVHTQSLQVMEERATDQGVKSVYSRYKSQNELNQKEFYRAYLLDQLNSLSPTHRHHMVVLSGMGTSSIGLCELDYSSMPFDSEGTALTWEIRKLRDKQQMLLISGIKSETGMMRGEEVQAIGLTDYMDAYGPGTLILPGTHSKHLTYKNGQFHTMRNYMTGELFEVLSQKSILANSIEFCTLSVVEERAFREGLALGFENKLSSSLLMIRAKDVVAHGSKTENYYFLSGLLIGDELCYLKNLQEHLFLAAPRAVYPLYKMALESLIAPEKLVLFDEEHVLMGLLGGQKKILRQHAG